MGMGFEELPMVDVDGLEDIHHHSCPLHWIQIVFSLMSES